MTEARSLIQAIRESLEALTSALDELEPPLSATDRQAVIQAALPVLLSAPSGGPSARAEPPRDTISPAATVMEAGVKSQTDQALCLAWFSYHHRGQAAFTAADLAAMFREVRLSVPVNPSDVALRLCKRGLLTPAEAEGSARKAYVISSRGDQEVAAWLGRGERVGG